MVFKYQAEITKHQGSTRIQTFFAQLCPRVVQFIPTGHSFSVQADATKKDSKLRQFIESQRAGIRRRQRNRSSRLISRDPTTSLSDSS